MRPSRVLSRLRSNRVARLACMYYPTAMMPVHAAEAGFDGVWIDTEHNSWDRRDIQRMILHHHLAGIDCLVRTTDRSPGSLYHLLDDGAAGLIIPHVNSAAEAADLVRAVRFPPAGQRGLDGACLDNDFYLRGTKGYPAAANRETLLIVQIETPEAVERVEEIASVPHLDGFFIGPGDLSLRLNCPADWSHPLMRDAQARVAAAAARHGLCWGRPSAPGEDLRQLIAAGGRFINVGSDLAASLTMLQQWGRDFAAAIGKE